MTASSRSNSASKPFLPESLYPSACNTSRYGIEAARMKRVTPADTPHTHPAALQDAVFLDRLKCILRAAWVKSTRRRQETRYPLLVESNEAQEDLLHCSLPDPPLIGGSPGAIAADDALFGLTAAVDRNTRARRNSRMHASWISRNSAEPRGGRATHTISQPGSIKSHASRTASCIRRRARLRSTAFPRRRLTVKPQRLKVRSLGSRHNTNNGCAWLTPVCRTSRNRSLSARRYRRFTSTPLQIAGYGLRIRMPYPQSLSLGRSPAQVTQIHNHQTVRRLRPRARRALSTLRPPLVLIRAKKPWNAHPAPGLGLVGSLGRHGSKLLKVLRLLNSRCPGSRKNWPSLIS